MEHEDCFETQEIVELEVEGFKKGAFKYKPTTAGQEISWINRYMKIDEKTKKQTIDHAELNKLKFLNIVAVPFSKELIKKLIGLEQEWTDLKEDSKWTLIGKLKPAIYDNIDKAIKNYDGGDVAKKA
jgi:hypothetical protein